MKKTLLAVIGLATVATTTLHAQVASSDERKWDARTEVLLRSIEKARMSRATLADSTARFILTATNPHAIADSVKAAGGEAIVVGEDLLTATLPLNSLQRIFAIDAITRVSRSVKAVPYMETARRETKTDQVHSGTGLETPFTGKGVIVGVIDVGFQYKHIAFNDAEGNTRVIGTWNRLKKNSPKVYGIPNENSDGDNSAGGHGTHVAGIAAGSRIAGNNFYGMAPEADIIMVPSTLESAEVLEDVEWIKHVADSLGQPFVVNMSFGSNYGAHDGTADFDVAVDALLGEGALVAAAMGNDGGSTSHVSYTFSDTETEKVVLIDNQVYGEALDYNVIDIWGNAKDGQRHLNFTPVYYNARLRKVTELNASQIQNALNAFHYVSPNNNKENYYCEVSLPTLANVVGALDDGDIYFGVKISAIDAGAGFHGWTMPTYGEFIKKTTNGIPGNDEYLVSQGSASIPRAIGVASSNGAGSWIAAADGQGYWTGEDYGQTGALSLFSSEGPSLGSDVKPTVAAPGSNVTSALNKYVTSFSLSDLTIVSAVKKNDGTAAPDYSAIKILTKNNFDYYGVMSGTSMATPAVSGILALWLQACPELTPEQAVEIIRETAVRDKYTGTAKDWTVKAGYGKIDAYEGLKKALQLNLADGIISQTMTRDNPVTLNKEAGEWRILFNTAEQGATVQIISLDGKVVNSRHLGAVYPGDEMVLGLDDLTPGMYVVRITTPHATLSRKLAVTTR